MKKDTITTAYADLKIGDVIFWYGAKVRITDVTHMVWRGKPCTYFSIEPYNDDSIQILGSFYSHGRYGGIDLLTVEKLR